MSTRISSLMLALLAAGCSEPLADKATRARAEQHARARDDAEGRLACALKGSATFSTACTIDRTHTQDGLILTVRHPDGGFHRLKVTDDGRGVVAADGAEPARVRLLPPDAIEVSIADARYLLPATIRPVRPRR